MRTADTNSRPRRSMACTAILKVRMQPELLERLESMSKQRLQPVSTTARQILGAAVGMVDPQDAPGFQPNEPAGN